MSADRNLLLGILALQMDFISRDALIQAMNVWATSSGPRSRRPPARPYGTSTSTGTATWTAGTTANSTAASASFDKHGFLGIKTTGHCTRHDIQIA
jgi:hypothetical protein